MSRKNPNARDDYFKRCLSVDAESETLDFELASDARAMQFLAGLHLLAKGCERFACLLHVVHPDWPNAVADCLLPDSIFTCVRFGARPDAPATLWLFNDVDCLTYEPKWLDVEKEGFTQVGFLTACDYIVDSDYETFISDAFLQKRIIAACLLETIADSCVEFAYRTNGETLLLEKDESASNAVAEFIGYIVGGKIATCPECGKPVLMPRETSTPYCSPTCKKAYNRRAQDMWLSTYDVERVIAAFPCISPDTVRGWVDW